MMSKYIIQDWVGNVLNHKGKFQRPELSVAMEFDDFESGWAWIYENITDESYYQDLYVEEKN